MLPASRHNDRAFPTWSIVVYVLVISVAVDAAFVVSSTCNLGALGTLITVLTSGVLAGGLLFTIFELQKLRR